MVPLRIVRVVIPVVIMAIGIFYACVSPADTLWIPKCPWWLLTGTCCPSCGIQRCLHLILNGHFMQAGRVNPYLTLAVPYATLAVIGRFYNHQGIFDRMNRILYSRPVLLGYVTIYFCWWAIRIIFRI